MITSASLQEIVQLCAACGGINTIPLNAHMVSEPGPWSLDSQMTIDITIDEAIMTVTVQPGQVSAEDMAEVLSAEIGAYAIVTATDSQYRIEAKNPAHTMTITGNTSYLGVTPTVQLTVGEVGVHSPGVVAPDQMRLPACKCGAVETLMLVRSALPSSVNTAFGRRRRLNNRIMQTLVDQGRVCPGRVDPETPIAHLAPELVVEPLLVEDA